MTVKELQEQTASHVAMSKCSPEQGILPPLHADAVAATSRVGLLTHTTLMSDTQIYVLGEANTVSPPQGSASQSKCNKPLGKLLPSSNPEHITMNLPDWQPGQTTRHSYCQ